MKRFAIVTMIFALATGPALAQQRATSRTDEQKKQDAEVDRAYQKTMQAIGSNKGPAAPADPWGNVRPAQSNTTKDKR